MVRVAKSQALPKNEIINKNIGYLNNIYVSRKSCVYKSTEPDELKWTNAFIINNDYKNVTLSNVYGAGYPTDALSLLSRINKKDYRNLDTLILLAVGNEQFAMASVMIDATH